MVELAVMVQRVLRLLAGSSYPRGFRPDLFVTTRADCVPVPVVVEYCNCGLVRLPSKRFKRCSVNFADWVGHRVAFRCNLGLIVSIGRFR